MRQLIRVKRCRPHPHPHPLGYFPGWGQSSEAGSCLVLCVLMHRKSSFHHEPANWSKCTAVSWNSTRTLLCLTYMSPQATVTSCNWNRSQASSALWLRIFNSGDNELTLAHASACRLQKLNENIQALHFFQKKIANRNECLVIFCVSLRNDDELCKLRQVFQSEIPFERTQLHRKFFLSAWLV